MIISHERLSDVERLHHLKTHLSGEAKHLLQNINIAAAIFNVAWETLSRTYENMKMGVNTHMQQITSHPVVHKESATDLKNLISSVANSVQALINLGRPTEHWDDILLYVKVKKLDPTSKNGKILLPKIRTFLRCLLLRYFRPVEFEH